MIVVVIIGILAAIAIPIFANQQKSALVAGIKSDVKNTNANILTALAKSPTAPDVKTLNAALVKSDPDTVITVGGTWDNYYIHATNKNIGTASTPQAAEGVTTTIPAQTRDIPIVNPDFESGISGWAKVAGEVVTHETANPISGTGSMKMASPSGTSQPAIRQFVNSPAKTGETISISAKYKTVGTNTDPSYPGMLYFQTALRSAAPTKFAFPNAATSVVTTTLVAEGDSAWVYIYIYASSDAGSELYVDDITATITTPATTSTTSVEPSYNQSSTGFGVVYSSSLGKIVTQND
jgi:Tfp pilus assembly major pilin PilA